MERIRAFFAAEHAPALIMAVAAGGAIVAANGPFLPLYESLRLTVITFGAGDSMVAKHALDWINDGLMAVFFLLVGLELKREFLTGHLSERGRATLPLIGALGGIAVPAAVFVAINWNSPATLGGWAIPAATDIVFALAILTAFGSRVPGELKVFLLALAVIDDVVAILIIALFYSEALGTVGLMGAAGVLSFLALLNRMGVRSLTPYMVGGLVLWAFVLGSGVHATLAGVLLAFTIPLRTTGNPGKSPARRLEHGLHDLSSFVILPVFAFANAGVSLGQIGLAEYLAPLPLGIALGLLIGKQAGVFGAAWLAVRFGLCARPESVSWRALYGVAVLTGIGFTMSLFIGTIAFDDPTAIAQVRGSVMAASLVSAGLGYLVLDAALPRTRKVTSPSLALKRGIDNAAL